MSDYKTPRERAEADGLRVHTKCYPWLVESANGRISILTDKEYAAASIKPEDEQQFNEGLAALIEYCDERETHFDQIVADCSEDARQEANESAQNWVDVRLDLESARSEVPG